MTLPFTKITEIPLGPVTIQVWGLMVAIGMLVGLWVALKEADRLKMKREVILDIFLMIVIGSMVGGRLLYVVLFWGKFADDPLSILKLWEGGMVLYGGVLGAVLPMVVYLRRKKISFWKVSDILAPGYAIGTFFGRMGCYLIGDHIGAPMGAGCSNCFWGATFPGEAMRRHEPSLYLSLNGLLMFLFLWTMRKRVRRPGELTLLMFMWEGLSRFILDFYRAGDLAGYSDPRFAGLTISQWAGAVLFFGALIGLYYPFISKKFLKQ